MSRDDVAESDLDAELRAALDVDPSPEFAARVRARIANGAPISRRVDARFVWAGAGALVLAAAFVWSSGVRPTAIDTRAVTAQPPGTVRQQAAIASNEHAPAPSIRPTPPPGALPAASRPSRLAVRHAERPHAGQHRAEPQVLVPPETAAVLDAFVEAAAERRIVLQFEPTAEANRDLPEIRDLTIAPITIEALHPFPADEGDRQ